LDHLPRGFEKAHVKMVVGRGKKGRLKKGKDVRKQKTVPADGAVLWESTHFKVGVKEKS